MKRFLSTHRYSALALVALIVAAAGYAYMPRSADPVDPHAAHKKLIADRLAGRGVPEMDVAVEFGRPQAIASGEETVLSWTMRDKETGEIVTRFDRPMEELLHLIIVDDALRFFDHVHPKFDGTKFSISYEFPEDDVYWLYLDFQPTGSSEIQRSFMLPVGAPSREEKPDDRSLSKAFGPYRVSLDSTFKARDFDLARSHLTFTVTDEETGEPETDLRPYLGAFGHLVMINVADHSYIHVHPLLESRDVDRSGPEVEFYPYDLRTGKMPPGTYRLFAQFNPPTGLFTADFTVDIR